MSAPVILKYRAFLSYAHADMTWGRWLHKNLEAFRIDKDLVGRATPMGPVPQNLRPIFRDCEDFSGGHTLTDATIAALDASAALIVLCSLTAATRPAVNEEVRLFRTRHPGRPVIPVIIDGTYPDNFPPALRVELAPDGTLTDRAITFLAPDLRETGDGKSLALAKTVATLIGVAPDDIRKRQAIADARRIKFASAVATSVAVLSIVAGYLFFDSLEKSRRHEFTEKDRLEREAVRDKQLVEMRGLVQSLLSVSSAKAASGSEAMVGNAVAAAVQGAAEGDPRLAKALELLKAGKPTEAEPLFRAVADEKGAKVQQDSKDTAAAYLNLGAIAGLGDPKRAREAYARALEFDGDSQEALYWHGWLNLLAGNLSGAEQSLNRLATLANQTANQRGIYRALLRLGEVAIQRGFLNSAREHQDKAFAIAREQSARKPNDLDWQRDVSVSYEKVGDVLVAQGQLPDALKAFRDSLSIRERLAISDPGNAGWQRDVSVSYIKVGDVLVAQGQLPDALKAFRDSLSIAERLSKSDAGNAGWQRDVSVSYSKIGDVQVAQGDLAGALQSFTSSRDILQRLAKSDPGNAGWQRDVAVSNERVGDMHARQGDTAQARVAFENALAAYKVLVERNPGDLPSKVNSVVPLLRLGGLKGPAGRADLEAALAILKPLAAANRLDANRRGWIPQLEAEIAALSK